MPANTLIFINGPLDGERIEVDDGMASFRAPVGDGTVVEYRRVSLADQDAQLGMMFFEVMYLQEGRGGVIGSLLAGYRRTNEQGDKK